MLNNNPMPPAQYSGCATKRYNTNAQITSCVLAANSSRTYARIRVSGAYHYVYSGNYEAGDGLEWIGTNDTLYQSPWTKDFIFEGEDAKKSYSVTSTSDKRRNTLTGSGTLDAHVEVTACFGGVTPNT